jgi:serine/threonine protein phosphatase 1
LKAKPVKHEFIDLSHKRRVLLAGDVHGEYTMLLMALNRLNWDKDLDQLILLGDIIDRGEENEQVLDFVDKSGTLRILGNHEMMPRMLYDRDISAETAEKWGGGWYARRNPLDIRLLAERVEAAPTIMTVLTPAGNKIGLSHADSWKDWNDMIRMVTHDSAFMRKDGMNKALWNCDTIEKIFKIYEGKEKYVPAFFDMKNIDHVFHGHSVVQKAFCFGDHSWIDTGACMGGHLTIIDPDKWLGEIETHRIVYG